MTSAATTETAEYRTQDLALAAFLQVKGVNHARLERVGDMGAWIYKETDEFKQLRSVYFSHEASVHPKEFQFAISNVRKELYDFLGRD